MTTFTPISASIGGLLIGLAAVALYQLNGRIAGISGIFFGLFKSAISEKAWRLLFIVGLILGGLVYYLFFNATPSNSASLSLPLTALGGLLVGIGTWLGSGCTSGHGVCGIARLSMRSIVATLIFLLFGVLSASLIHGVLL